MDESSLEIRLFAMDVDGTLTDGSLTLTSDGQEQKTFHARDGAGIKLLPAAGMMTAVISGRASAATQQRMTELGIDEIHQDVADKADRLTKVCEYFGMEPGQAAFVGDDLSDIPAMRLAGYAGAPGDAAEEVKAVADFVATAGGGQGAVREIVEDLLKRLGLWQEVLEAFEATEAPA